MANTQYLKQEVEDYVRNGLAEKYSQPFSKRRLRLTTGGKHEFDAVSEDGEIIAGIKTCLLPKPGQVKSAITELYYLSLVDAPVRVLILTWRPFYDTFRRRIDGAIFPGLTIECIDLPSAIQNEVNRIIAEATREVTPAQAVVEETEEELT